MEVGEVDALQNGSSHIGDPPTTVKTGWQGAVTRLASAERAIRPLLAFRISRRGRPCGARFHARSFLWLDSNSDKLISR
jgi:hypothetical protein